MMMMGARKVLSAADHRKLKAVVDAVESLTSLMAVDGESGPKGQTRRRCFSSGVPSGFNYGVSVRGNTQSLVETRLPNVLRESFPMNPAIDGLRLVVRQTDLARPEAPLKVTVCGRGLTPIDRLTRRS